jgi:limonene-1,2-epoxide hydrolase
METSRLTDAATDARDISVVEDFFDACQASDLDRAVSLLSEDIVYQNVPFPADHGKAAVLRTLKGFGRFVPKFDVRIKNIAARNGVVLTERVDVLSGPLVHLEIWVCGTFEVNEGRITLWRDYFDLASATTQLFTGRVRKLLAREG